MKSLEDQIIAVFDDEAQFGNPVYADELVNRLGSTREEVLVAMNKLLDEKVIIGTIVGVDDIEFDIVFELAPRDEDTDG